MIGQVAKVSWSQRGIHVAVVATLSIGALVLAVLVLLASAMDTSQGDPGTLAVIGVIAAACTVVVLDAVTRQGISERWPSLRRLRIIGLGSWALRWYLAGEALLLAFVASMLGYLVALVISPALVPYLSAMGVVPAEVHADPTVATAAQVAAATAVIALVAASGAARRAARREPVDVGLVAERSPTARYVGGGFTGLIALLVGVAVWQAVTAGSAESGYVWGLVATASTLGLLSRIWRPLAARVAEATIRLWPRASAPALVSARWTAGAGKATTSAAVMLAVGLTVFFIGFPAVSDDAARDRLSQMLSGSTVLTHPTGDADAASLVSDGVVLTQADVAIDGTGYQEPAQFLSSDDAQTFLGPYLTGSAASERPGVVVTADRAAHAGLQVGQRVRVGPDASSVTLPIIAVAGVPAAMGDFFVVGATVPVGSRTGPTTVITDSPASPAPPGWSNATGDEWIAELPPGAAVSATGGQGTGEAPLLVGAPLALAFALALSSTVIAVLARRQDITQLGRIGMSRHAVLTAVARQALAVTVPPALVALALSGLIVTAATAPYIAALGGGPLSIGPLGTYLTLIAALVLTVVVTALTASRTALYRPR